MERHYQHIRQYMNTPQWLELLIYSTSIAGGFILGGYLGSGKPIGMFMRNPVVLLVFLITTAILVPACFYLAKWIGRRAFGQYAEQLKINIDALKNEK
jgi:hypothetical protein